MQLARVVLDIPTQALDTPYTYALSKEAACGAPAGYDEQLEALLAGVPHHFCVQLGCAVLVPFGHRYAIGFVVEIQDDGAADDDAEDDGATSDCKPSDSENRPRLAALKPVLCAVSKPYFDEEGAACALWMAANYIAPLAACVRLFTPPGGVPRLVRRCAGSKTSWQLEHPKVGSVDDRWVFPGANYAEPGLRKAAIKQQAIVDALKAGPLRASELSAEFGSISAALHALEAKGVVRIEHRRRLRGVPDGALEPPVQEGQAFADQSDGEAPLREAFVPSTPPPLTSGQQDALFAIRDAYTARGGVVLVDGVTGSGKTEVYLQAIAEVLEHGQAACVLVPEIALTPQTVARFRGRFGDVVAVMHSRMSQGERYDQWDFIRSGQARVVVGARSALFTPLRNVGMYVIDEEHESSYKQESAPRYHARQVACWMAQRSGAVVVLGSATPSIESLYRCAHDDAWRRVVLPARANGRKLPPIEVIDMAAEFGSGFRSMFSRHVIHALEEELSAGHKAVLLLNQRGFARFLLCRDCGFVPECPSCSTSLTFHEQGNKLVCHHCGHTESAPSRCPRCASPYLKKFGAGTQRVETELRGLLDGMGEGASRAPIIRMDADTTSRKGAHQRLLEEFAQADAAVLLGTQMIAKGLDFADVTLVVVINADTQLHLPDYRAAERTFILIEQVAGRAGRADLPGRVMVQSYEADNAAIVAAAAYDREQFLRPELVKRRLLHYPPYVRLVNVLVWGKDASLVAQETRQLQEKLEEHLRDFGGDGWQVLPAGPCLLSKLRGLHRWHILLKCPSDARVSAVLEPFFRARKAHASISVAVDIDPTDLF